MSTRIFIDGFKSLEEVTRQVGDIDSDIKRIMPIAVNYAATRGRTEAQRRGEREVAFPTGYLAPGGGRLKITKRAKVSDPEAFIFGRGRPTSLARFLTGSPSKKGDGLLVQVTPGRTQRLERAFLVNIRSGNTETRNNLGIAIRLPAGRRPSRASSRSRPVELAPGLFLLYGPSVNQMLQLMAEKGLSDSIASELQAEFLRQFDL